MKNLYIFLFSVFFLSWNWAQNSIENSTIIDQEISRYKLMIDYNVNPNTLNYDLQYQRLEVELDPTVLWISGSVTSHFKAKAEMSSIYFDFSHLVPVSKVTYHDQELNFAQLSTKELKIDFPTSIPVNAIDSVTVFYAGAPDNTGRASFFVGNHNGEATLSTLSQPYGAQNWFPTKQSMNDKIDRFDFKITTDQQYSVGANGKLMSETLLPGNKKLTFWRTQYPTAAYLIALSVANFSKFNDTIGNTNFPYLNYLYADSAADSAVLNNLQWTKTVMEIFENHFGNYPFAAEKYGHMQFNVNGAAMEHQTMSSMDSFPRAAIIHELAHQWFGDKITCGAWNDVWLNEGFATFGEQLIFEKNLMNHDQFLNYLSEQITTITSLPNGSIYVKDSDLGNVATVFNGRLTYVKSAFVVRMMKWILGDDMFFQVLRDFLSNPAFAYQYAKTEDFKNQLLISTGKDFTEFFNDWIYGQGYPTYQIKWNQPAGTNDLNFFVSQSQSDSSVNFFEMPLPIKVNGTNSEVAYLVLDNSVNDQMFFESVNFQVASVEFNYEYQIIEKNSTVSQVDQLAVENPTKTEFMIYPNPAKNEMYIKGISHKAPYEIHAIDGKIVRKGNYQPGKSIETGFLEKGMYIISIEGRTLKFNKN